MKKNALVLTAIAFIAFIAIAIITILKPGNTAAQKKNAPVTKQKTKLLVPISTDEWNQVNGPYGGWIRDMENSGNDLIVGTSFTYELGGNGIYRVSNNGSYWQALGGTTKSISDISVDPSNSNNIFFIADALYSTRDGGGNWQKTDLGVEIYRQVAVSKANPSLVFAGTVSENRAQLFTSTDGGANWQLTSTLPDTNWSVSPIWAGIPDEARNWISAIAPHPTNENLLFVGTNSALFKSTDKGQNWTRADSTFHRSDILGIAINPLAINEVYVRVGVYEDKTCMSISGLKNLKKKNKIEKSKCAGVYKSNDYGTTWKQLNSYYFDPSEGGIFLDPRNSNIAYSIFSRLIQKTSNSGNTWKKFFWTHDNDRVLNVGIERLAVGQNSKEIFTAGRQGLLRTTNSGKSWQDKNKGFVGSEVVDIVTTKNGTLYAGTYSLGMFRSTNKGQSWSFSSYKLQDPYVMALTKHPTDPGSIYLTTNGGVYSTSNSARSWKVVAPKYFFGKTGILAGIAHFHGIAFDPKNKKRIYVGGGGDQYAPQGSGISISEDGGKTWKASNRGFKTDVHVSKIIVDEKKPATVYATTQGSTEYQEKKGDGQGVYKSVNYGKNWKKMNKGLTTKEVNTISIHPKNSKILFLGTDDKGIFKSTNGGKTWRSLTIDGLPKSYGVGDIAVDPKRPKNVYAATVDYFRLFNSRGMLGDHGVYKSQDGGNTWSEFNENLNHKGAYSLEIDKKGNIIYVGTRGGGIYWRKIN